MRDAAARTRRGQPGQGSLPLGVTEHLDRARHHGADKARRFPGSRILIGVDALIRMLDPKWGPPIEPMLQEFRQLGIKFLVADREVDGKLLTLDGLAPTDLFQRVLRPAQHLALSSTKLRQGALA